MGWPVSTFICRWSQPLPPAFMSLRVGTLLIQKHEKWVASDSYWPHNPFQWCYNYCGNHLLSFCCSSKNRNQEHKTMSTWVLDPSNLVLDQYYVLKCDLFFFVCETHWIPFYNHSVAYHFLQNDHAKIFDTKRLGIQKCIVFCFQYMWIHIK